MWEILCKTNSGSPVDIKFSPYIYNVDGTLNAAVTPWTQTFSDANMNKWVSWKVGATTVDFTDFTETMIIGEFQRLVHTLNETCLDFIDAVGIEYLKFAPDTMWTTLGYPRAQYFEYYNILTWKNIAVL